MAKLAIKPGSTDVTLLVWVQDSASTSGAGKTGLAYNTSGLVCYYARPGAAAAALSLVTQTVNGGHADGGFVEVDAANMPGLYRLDLSDAIVASAVRSAVVMLHGAAGMAPLVLEIDLAAQVDAVAISGDAVAEIADGVWDEALSGHAGAGTAGKALSDAGAAGNPWEATGLEAMSAGTAGHELHLAKAALANKIAHDQVARTRTIYADDGTTPLRVLQASSDMSGETITEAPL